MNDTLTQCSRWPTEWIIDPRRTSSGRVVVGRVLESLTFLHLPKRTRGKGGLLDDLGQGSLDLLRLLTSPNWPPLFIEIHDRYPSIQQENTSRAKYFENKLVSNSYRGVRRSLKVSGVEFRRVYGNRNTCRCVVFAFTTYWGHPTTENFMYSVSWFVYGDTERESLRGKDFYCPGTFQFVYRSLVPQYVDEETVDDYLLYVSVSYYPLRRHLCRPFGFR